MDDVKFKRFFASLLTVIGIFVVLFACAAFMSDRPVLGFSITKWESIVPFAVGIVFLLSGVNLINRS